MKFLKNIAVIIAIGLLVAFIELSSVAHPLERMVLRVSGAMKGIAQMSESEMKTRTEHIRALLYNTEIVELRKQLTYKERSDVRTIGASISGTTTDPSRTQFLIDRGSRDGITAGAPVIAGDGILIGIVYNVSERVSMIMSLRDPRSSILALIPSETDGIHGIAKGRFNVGVDLTYIPITKELTIGDSIVTSGLQQGIPAGLVLGTVQEVRKNPQELFQSAELAVPYAESMPLDVLVVTENKNNE